MIQTVSGAIAANDVGNVLMHEHISCASLSFSTAFGTEWLDSERLCSLSCDTLKIARREWDIGLLVDATPIDLGRNAPLLKRVSELSGTRIVASTGFYHLPSIECGLNDPSVLAPFFINECKNGIADTGIKPGILKCATGPSGLTPDNQCKLKTMATVQKETALALYVHCDHRENIAHGQIDLLLEGGASAERLIIGHAAIRHGADYLAGILERGCYVCMDQCHCFDRSIADIGRSLAQLCERGYTERLLISNDYCIHSDFPSHQRNGFNIGAKDHAQSLGYVFIKLHAAFIAAGGREEDWCTVVRENPLRALDVNQ